MDIWFNVSYDALGSHLLNYIEEIKRECGYAESSLGYDIIRSMKIHIGKMRQEPWFLEYR